jgi:glycosyltransferase involved in cell wall biosynthesis
MKKKVLILFPSEHLAYSPTIINLYDFLAVHFDVTIIAPSPKKFNNQVLENRKVIYHGFKYKKPAVAVNRIRFELTAIFDKYARLFRKKDFNTGDFFYAFKVTKKFIEQENPDHIIAVDFRNLLFCQILEKKAHFLSLEIRDNKYYPECDFSNIESVIIQSKERYDHLFAGKKFKTYFVQNAPVYRELDINVVKKGLVYCGTAWDDFGFYHCLEYLKAFPSETMTVKGALLDKDRARVKSEYKDLLEQSRLIIDDLYADETEIIAYLNSFRIGFCFYNFDLPHIRTFNYYSAPSGKLFKYIAAGVPVIGSDISGLSAVNEFNCGVLIKDLKPVSIRQAIEKIESNYDFYSANCLKAAQHYSFDKTIKPFIDSLRNE